MKAETLQNIPWAPQEIHLETVACPVCDQKNFKHVRKSGNLHLDPKLFTRKGYKPYPMHPEEASIAQCRVCGLVQVNPRRKSEDLIGLNNALHLMKDYKDGKVESGEVLTGEGDRALRENRFRKIQQFKREGKWLDVGCGAGRDLDMAVENGFEGYGVELSEVKKEFYKNKKFSVHIGSFEEAPFAENSFDVITMWDVLEHVEDTNRVLDKVFSLLKPDGIFVAKVPNHAALNRRVNGRWWDMYHPLHLYYFTRRTLGLLLEKRGFQVVHAYSINPYGLGCLLKDFAKSWNGNSGSAESAAPAAQAPQASVNASAANPFKVLAKTAFRIVDWLPKKLSLRLLTGNFIILTARKSA